MYSEDCGHKVSGGGRCLNAGSLGVTDKDYAHSNVVSPSPGKYSFNK